MLNIKQFGDVHFNEFFSIDKLSIIEDRICDGKTNKLIITGGISTIVKTNYITGKLSNLFPMNINEIEYNSEDRTSTVKTLSL